MLQAANAAGRAWLGGGSRASTEKGTWLGAQVTELHIRDWKQVDTGKGRLVTHECQVTTSAAWQTLTEYS